MPGKSLEHEQAEAAREAVLTLLRAHKGNQTAAAKAIGMTQPSLSNIINRKTKAGSQTISRVAVALGWSINRVLGEGRGDDDPGLVAALEAKPRPAWLQAAARSKRAAEGAVGRSAQWWEAWLSALEVADAVADQEPSKEEQAFERKKAKRRG